MSAGKQEASLPFDHVPVNPEMPPFLVGLRGRRAWTRISNSRPGRSQTPNRICSPLLSAITSHADPPKPKRPIAKRLTPGRTSLKPTNLGNLLYQSGRQSESLACFRWLLALNLNYPSALGNVAECQAWICQWQGHHQTTQELLRSVQQRRTNVPPLAFLHFCVYNRNGIFAFRAAPIQVSYVGFPGSMGAAFIDYLLADRFVIPEALESCYREDVVCLPDTFQCSSSRRIAEQTPTRRELGLPESGFVFCCFNGAYKIRPAIFDIWMAAHEALALQLATQPGLLTALRLRLEADRYTQPLFNVDRFRRHIEAAHQGMWENSAGG